MFIVYESIVLKEFYGKDHDSNMDVTMEKMLGVHKQYFREQIDKKAQSLICTKHTRGDSRTCLWPGTVLGQRSYSKR